MFDVVSKQNIHRYMAPGRAEKDSEFKQFGEIVRLLSKTFPPPYKMYVIYSL